MSNNKVVIYLTRHGHSCANLLSESTQTNLDNSFEFMGSLNPKLLTIGFRAQNSALTDIGILRSLNIGFHLYTNNLIPNNFLLFSSGLRRAIETAYYQYGIFYKKKVNLMPGINETSNFFQTKMEKIFQTTAELVRPAINFLTQKSPSAVVMHAEVAPAAIATEVAPAAIATGVAPAAIATEVAPAAIATEVANITGSKQQQIDFTSQSKFDFDHPFYHGEEAKKMIENVPSDDKTKEEFNNVDTNSLLFYVFKDVVEGKTTKSYDDKTNSWNYVIVSHGGYIRKFFEKIVRKMVNSNFPLPKNPEPYNNQIYKIEIDFNDTIYDELKKMYNNHANKSDINDAIARSAIVNVSNVIPTINTDTIDIEKLKNRDFFNRCCEIYVEKYSKHNCRKNFETQQLLNDINSESINQVWEDNKKFLMDKAKNDNYLYTIINFINGFKNSSFDYINNENDVDADAAAAAAAAATAVNDDKTNVDRKQEGGRIHYKRKYKKYIEKLNKIQ